MRLLSLLVASLLGLEALSQLVNMYITSDERDFLDPLFLCSAASSPGDNRRHCLEPYKGALRRIGIRVQEDAFVSPEQSFFFIYLLRCSRTSIAAGRNRCVRDVLSSYEESGVDVHALVLIAPRLGYTSAAAAAPSAGADLKRNVHDTLEYQLSGVLVPINETLTMDEARFYEPLVTCSAVFDDNEARQACMHGYLRRWERMGVIVPRHRRLTHEESVLLMSLLHCESLPAASVRQAACIGERIEVSEQAGVASAWSLVDAGLADRIREAATIDGGTNKSFLQADRR